MSAVERKDRNSHGSLKRRVTKKVKPEKKDNGELGEMDLDQFMTKMIEDEETENQQAAEIEDRKPEPNLDEDLPDSEPLAKSAREQVDSYTIYDKYKKPKYLEKSTSAREHKAVLGSLKEKDPALFKYLEKTDRDIFNFDESSDDDVHQPPSKLVTARKTVGDDSSSDEETQMAMESQEHKLKKGRIIVTLTMIETWEIALHDEQDFQTLMNLISAFQAAVAQAGGNQEAQFDYLVEGSNEFNAIIRTCLKELPYILPIMLKTKGVRMTSGRQRLHSKIRNALKIYFADLGKLIIHLAEPEVINTLLKHVNQMIKYIACTRATCRTFLKTLIKIWSQGEETSRVLAFMSIIKILQLLPWMIEKTLKTVYKEFVSNTKFTSPTLLPLINFMKHSMVEIFKLNPAVGYQYTFAYVRQLAIHLRNSMAVKKSEGYLMVYNWQYVHSLSFFSMLICSAKDDTNIQQLLFPLVQVIIGAIRCVPTAKFYPLRLHCIRMLNMIAKHTGVYVPSISILLEIFEMTDFHKRYKKGLTKSIDMSTVLKLTKHQLADRSFLDTLMDHFYELFLDGITIYSHTVGFPELCVPLLLPMKQFVKRVKVANFSRQVKQLVQKTKASVDYVQRKRDAREIDIRDTDAVRAFENRMKKEGTPLTIYHKQYRKLRDRETQLEISGKERMETFDNTPILPTGQPKATEKERADFKELFADWSSEEENEDAEADEERFKLRKDRKKPDKTKDEKSVDDDDAESLHSDDYNLMNQSSDEGDDEIEDEDEDEGDNSADDSIEDEESVVEETVVEEDEPIGPADEVKEFSLNDF